MDTTKWPLLCKLHFFYFFKSLFNSTQIRLIATIAIFPPYQLLALAAHYFTFFYKLKENSPFQSHIHLMSLKCDYTNRSAVVCTQCSWTLLELIWVHAHSHNQVIARNTAHQFESVVWTTNPQKRRNFRVHAFVYLLIQLQTTQERSQLCQSNKQIFSMNRGKNRTPMEIWVKVKQFLSISGNVYHTFMLTFTHEKSKKKWTT